MQRITWAAGGALLLAALTGCGAHGGGSGGAGGGPASPGAATGSLEQLAARARCRPDLQTDADELRQALCGSGTRRYVLATFATDRGQAEWLDEAGDYGGTYLVGRKWVAAGDERVITPLRERLGGTVERGSAHGATGGGGDGAHGGHGGHGEHGAGGRSGHG